MNDASLVIEAQKEQIARYQSRLKDVVSAYKSLLKEKEALDLSIKALTTGQKSADPSTSPPDPDGTLDESKQIMLSSLATLSAEKSRMEAGFQNDKKQMRLELSAKDKKIRELNDKLKSVELEKENCKAKLISFDRILSDEKHLKDSLELQLLQLKTQFSQTSNSDKIIKEQIQEIHELRKKIKTFESNTRKNEDSSILQLQSEMESLRQQHCNLSLQEQKRANEVNEKSRKLTTIHEKQVQSLEARLSELSDSVANYHKLREADQISIASLKDKISQLSEYSRVESLSAENSNKFQQEDNVQAVIEEINRLKSKLVYENSRLEQPLDLSAVLSRSPNAVDETVSAEKYKAKKQLCNKLKSDNDGLKQEVAEQSLHIKTLQDKVSVLNHNIEELENLIKSKSLEINTELRTERNKWRETINSAEIAHRSKISQLEQQLQKQRERSLILLEEKENELRSLKTSYELFLPKSQTDEDDGQFSSSSGKRKTSLPHHLGVVLNQASSSSHHLPETHMIYYSNELARKEMELTSVRKAQREAETLIRQTLKEKIMMQEEMDERIMTLEQQVDRLERTKSREGANLEYLKNVTLSFLTASDHQSKMKILNAIGAVLKFNQQESTLIKDHFEKKK